MNKNTDIKVSVVCLVYNHEPYLRQCLDGFVSQKTKFRFEVFVHDDASTDGSAKIILEYAEKYPSIIKPIIESENQYSKKDGSLGRIIDENIKGKYVAYCEGDDYWTDPMKLQIQYDMMESNPQMTICFHSNNELYPDKRMKVHKPQVVKSLYTLDEAVLGGGSFMATNTMFCRYDLYREEGKPLFWTNCPVGDLPTMLFYASKGEIGYVDKVMSVYRVASEGSWTSRQNSYVIRRRHHQRILKMWDEFDEYTHFEHHKSIVKKKRINKRIHYKDAIGTLIHIFCPWLFNKRRRR